MAETLPVPVAPTQAPVVTIGAERLISVEHPGVTRGRNASKMLSLPASERVSLHMRNTIDNEPNVASDSTIVHNPLLKITVPKCIGKRKRGSDQAFTTVASAREPGRLHVDLNQLMHVLADKPDAFRIKCVGHVEQGRLFRALPDYRYDSSQSILVKSVKRHLLSRNYHKLSNFRLGQDPASFMMTNTIAPPVFVRDQVSFPWAFRQNPFFSTDHTMSGQQEPELMSRPYAVEGWHVRFDITKVPSAALSEWKAEEAMKPRVRDLILSIRSMMEQQPVLTKRQLYHRLQPRKHTELRNAMKHCGYQFSSGPWRDAVIRYGHDPRKYPADRQWQTLSFNKGKSEPAARLSEDGGTPATPANFDGLQLPQGSRTYQVCEVTDPLLRGILDLETPQSTCSVSLTRSIFDFSTDDYLDR